VTARERIFVALDTPDAARARELVSVLRDRVGGFKIGLEMFCAQGPTFVRELVDGGATVFLDLKLHDIPNTVAGAAAAAAGLGASFLTVHALGGPLMIRRAVEAVSEPARSAGGRGTTVLAVTVLTSHDDRDLERLGLGGPASAAVERLAALAREGGAGGVVCSPREIPHVRSAFPEAIVVVPGIRPSGVAVRADDQQRTDTPGGAVARGADRLVVGRPITQAPDPLAAAEAIARDIASGEGQ